MCVWWSSRNLAKGGRGVAPQRPYIFILTHINWGEGGLVDQHHLITFTFLLLFLLVIPGKSRSFISTSLLKYFSIFYHPPAHSSLNAPLPLGFLSHCPVVHTESQIQPVFHSPSNLSPQLSESWASIKFIAPHFSITRNGLVGFQFVLSMTLNVGG